MCIPSWHSEPVFATLIGGRGVYAVTPRDPWRVEGGYYEDGSLIWRNRWVTSDGIIECRDALACPGDPSRVCVLRRVMATEPHRPARLTVRLDTSAGFLGEAGRDFRRGDDGTWTWRTGRLFARWAGAGDARPENAELRLDLDVRPGDHHDLVLELSTHAFDHSLPRPDQVWEATARYWTDCVPPCDDTLAPRDARQAYAVLRGLTTGYGAMVAAATMCLPERAERGRNYDYRYAWIRDQCYAGQAVGAHGPHPLLDMAVTFVAERILADGPTLRPAYLVTGEQVPDERPLPLPGYPGSAAVVGNRAGAQFQLDVFGEALLLFAEAARHDRLTKEASEAVDMVIAAIQARWQEPDSGIWELGNEYWTHSRLICAAGLRSIAGIRPNQTDRDMCRRLADEIVSTVSRTCVRSDGAWQRTPVDRRVDAALLLPGVRGALPPSDPRTNATISAVLRELERDGYLYRFRHDSRPLHEAEGSFTACGFMMALAQHRQGAALDALRWFERNRAAYGTTGLYAEEFDVVQRQLRGNLPQTLVHALGLECAVRLTG
jgi:GH15 family glucan-1,4-alpha-glucosidase